MSSLPNLKYSRSTRPIGHLVWSDSHISSLFRDLFGHGVYYDQQSKGRGSTASPHKENWLLQ